MLKGKSFGKVKSRNTAHQVARLRRLPGIELMVFLAVGHIQDGAKVDFIQAAIDADSDYLIVDAADVARLFIAYEKICSQDGAPYDDRGVCECGHHLDPGIELTMAVREDPRYEVVRLEDVSHAGARSYSATLLVDRHYARDVLRQMVVDATQSVRNQDYARNEMVTARWGSQPAHVVWLFVACEPEDIRNTNWLCRTQWIDDGLVDNMRPISLNADEQVNGVGIAWNDDYESRKEMHREHSSPKGEYLRLAAEISEQMITFGQQAASWFASYEDSKMSEKELIAAVQSDTDRVRDTYLASGDMPFPPEDCKRYDEHLHGLCAIVDNMYLLWSEKGAELWPEPNRRYLVSDAVKRFIGERDRLAYEAERLH